MKRVLIILVIMCFLIISNVYAATIVQWVGENDEFPSWYKYKTNLKQKEENEKFGLVNEKGEEIVPCIYDYIGFFDEDGICDVRKNKKSGYIDKDGKEIVPCIYDDVEANMMGYDEPFCVIRYFRHGFSSVLNNEKYGIINEKGEEVIPCIYDQIISLEDGRFKVRVDKKWEIIDTNGKNVLFRFSDNDKYGFKDIEGNIIVPCIYDDIGFYHDDLGIFEIKQNNKWGYANIKNEIVVPCIYDDIESYYDGLGTFKIRQGNKYGIANTKNEIVVPCIYDDIGNCNKEWGIIEVKQNNKYGYINLKYETIVPCIYDEVRSYIYDEYYSSVYEEYCKNGGLIVVKKDNKWGIINAKNETVVPCIYLGIQGIYDGLIEVIKGEDYLNQKYGYLNMQGEEIIPCIYDYITNMYDGICIAQNQNEVIILNNKGEKVKKLDYDEIEEVGIKLHVIKKDGKYGYINEKGEEIIPCILENANSILEVEENEEWYTLVLSKNGEEILNCSNWAKDEIRKVNNKNLMPKMLENLDLRHNITRREFASVAVKLYEEMSNKEVSTIENSFIDIKNSDIDVIKAYNLGITKGVSDTRFAPDELITREQMATMMLRTLECLGIDTKVSNINKFEDDLDISNWAKDGVYFMANNNIIKGVGENKFGSKGNATREQALLVALRCMQNLEK